MFEAFGRVAGPAIGYLHVDERQGHPLTFVKIPLSVHSPTHGANVEAVGSGHDRHTVDRHTVDRRACKAGNVSTIAGLHAEPTRRKMATAVILGASTHAETIALTGPFGPKSSAS